MGRTWNWKILAMLAVNAGHSTGLMCLYWYLLSLIDQPTQKHKDSTIPHYWHRSYVYCFCPKRMKNQRKFKGTYNQKQRNNMWESYSLEFYLHKPQWRDTATPVGMALWSTGAEKAWHLRMLRLSFKHPHPTVRGLDFASLLIPND